MATVYMITNKYIYKKNIYLEIYANINDPSYTKCSTMKQGNDLKPEILWHVLVDYHSKLFFLFIIYLICALNPQVIISFIEISQVQFNINDRLKVALEWLKWLIFTGRCRVQVLPYP